MSQQYDKILKENIEAVFLPLAEKYVRQLTILSRLRNLEEVVTKKVKEMLKDKSLSVEKITNFAKVSVDYVKQLQHTLNL